MIGVWIEDGRVEVRSDLPDPTAADSEAVVAVKIAGVCGTDLALLDGYKSFRGIPGHEFVGVVEKGPPGWMGARVVADINVTCASYPPARDRCPSCGWGRETHCERRTILGISGRDGVFAEKVALPLANLYRVPVLMPDEVAVFVEPLAAAYRILEQVEITEATRVLVVGPGRLGQLVARVLAGTGARLKVAGRSEEGLERTRRAGITAVTLEEIDPGAFDVAVDCTGHPDGFGLARAAVRAAGTLVLKSTFPGRALIEVGSRAVDEITVVGSRCGPFRPALAALASGDVDVADLIDSAVPLPDAPRAFEHASRPGVAKVLLEI
jgi:threonine dehydrogenase-like Zn-dependent dehydrogenase